MAKRKKLGAVLEQAQTAKAGVPPAPLGDTVTSGFNMQSEMLSLLKAVAMKRAKERGGRPSVSAILTELVEAQRAELEKEAGPWLELVKKGLI